MLIRFVRYIILGNDTRARTVSTLRSETGTRTVLNRVPVSVPSENLDAITWYRTNSGNETHAVAAKEENSWGLYDMLGNVWEWCADYDAMKRRMSESESTFALRVVWGGSWFQDARVVHAAHRLRHEPSLRDNNLGFRCAEFRRGS